MGEQEKPKPKVQEKTAVDAAKKVSEEVKVVKKPTLLEMNNAARTISKNNKAIAKKEDSKVK